MLVHNEHRTTKTNNNVLNKHVKINKKLNLLIPKNIF